MAELNPGPPSAHAATAKSASPAARRMRVSRSRRRHGRRVVPFEVRDLEVHRLIDLKLLDPARRDDREAIADALGALLDCLPAECWNRAAEAARDAQRASGAAPSL
jgi:hypothetical protein